MEEDSRASGPGSDDRDLLKDPSGDGGPEAPEKPPRSRAVRWLWWGLGLVKSGLEVAVVAALLWLFVFQVSVVLGHSMDPSLGQGDRLVVDKLTHRFASIGRFDVVVFRCPDRRGDDYVKRVVGLPGETIEMRGGELYVDGEHIPQDFDFVPGLGAFEPKKVPEGQYFVLGDNRPRSRDSHSGLGTIDEDLIKGVVRLRVYPFSRAGSIPK
ncbi:MAG: signal peptidase I [Planctomycetota bacterium]|jgi:signal peptidase I